MSDIDDLKAQLGDHAPFQLAVSLYDPAGTVRREERWALGAGQTPNDDVINIWLCEPYTVRVPGAGPKAYRTCHQWRCIESRQQIWLGQVVGHGEAAGWPVIGAAPGTPAWRLWLDGARLPVVKSPVRPLSADALVRIREFLREGRSRTAIIYVRDQMGGSLVEARDRVNQLRDEMRNDTHTVAVADSALDEEVG
jgi:hypothetical protein